jgi:hypothetical protein
MWSVSATFDGEQNANAAELRMGRVANSRQTRDGLVYCVWYYNTRRGALGRYNRLEGLRFHGGECLSVALDPKWGPDENGWGAAKDDRPVFGRQYSLTGAPGETCILNGNTWAESEYIPKKGLK